MTYRRRALALVQENEFGADNANEPSGSTEYFDLTGMFHWCPAKKFDDVMITPDNASQFDLSEHYIVIVFADSDSPMIGLRSFVMPLRTSNFRLNELKPIVFISNEEFLRKEWNSLKNFPKVYMLPGSPMDRLMLCSAKIDLCGMCVIMSAKSKWKDQMEPYLIDKEVVLCTLNINAMPLAEGLDLNVEAQMPMRMSTPILTEIFVARNIQFLDEDDHNSDVSDIYKTLSYACGIAFTTDVLDSLMSTVFYSMNAMTLIRTLVTGGATPEMDVLVAERLSKKGIKSTPEIEANRNRCRIMQLPMLDSRLRQYEQSTFADLFTGVLASHGILCLGVHRRLDSYRACVDEARTKRVVVTSPTGQFRLVGSDLVYCLVPFQ